MRLFNAYQKIHLKLIFLLMSTLLFCIQTHHINHTIHTNKINTTQEIHYDTKNTNITQEIHYDTNNTNITQEKQNQNHTSLILVDFGKVRRHMLVCVWVILVCATIVGFRYIPIISSFIPESCVLIMMGILIGYIYKKVKWLDYIDIDPELFFFVLLPPIILDAGYFVKARAFFENIFPILLHAVVGTMINTFLLGVILWGSSGHLGIPEIGINYCFLFASIISAVDPVAVLAVFNELHVHHLLFIIVFGESILNDAVTISLFNVFNRRLKSTDVNNYEIFKGIASFFIGSILGVTIGIFFGLLTALLTRFTKRVRLLEPVVVLLVPYIGYLVTETFHFSGILSILFSGIVMRPYVEINISYKSKIAIQRALRVASTIFEALIFIFLGCTYYTYSLEHNYGFIFIALLGIIVCRIISVVALTWFSNLRKPSERVSMMEQFVMIYGGLRGAVAISLVLVYGKSNLYGKMFVATTHFVVLFTNFVMGISIKPIVRCLKIKTETKRKQLMLEEMNFKMVDHLNRCAIAICGTDKLSGIKKIVSRIDKKCQSFLTGESKTETKHKILATNIDILYKEAANLVKTNPSALINLFNFAYDHIQIEFRIKNQDKSSADQSKYIVLEDVPTRDTTARLRLHQSNFAKGQNIFDNYVMNAGPEDITENNNKIGVSELNFMTRNESFYGPHASFTVNRNVKHKTLFENPYNPVKPNREPEDIVPAIVSHPTSKKPNQMFPLVIIEESPNPLFSIVGNDHHIQYVSMKELSDLVQEPPKSLKDLNQGHTK